MHTRRTMEPRWFGTAANILVPRSSAGPATLRCLSPADPIGLHLNYELRLPASTSRDTVIATLIELHAFAQTLPLASLSPLLIEHGGPIDDGDRLASLRFWTPLIAAAFDGDDPPLTGDPNSAQGFFVLAGKGCETASFGFMRRSDAGRTHAEWFWYCGCKTQYASMVSDAHLIACHTALVGVLDHAITLGIDVVVRDETHFWETRDKTRLVAEVHTMNQIVARIAGRLDDAIGDTEQVRAPIFDHPRFERLEMGDDD